MEFSDPVVAGNVLLRDAIRSPNFVTGVSGWSINASGSAEFNSTLVRGELDLGPASPSPRAAINPTIPTALSTWDVNVTFQVVSLWYFNATDYYWQAIGTFFGTKCYMEGTYDTTNGPYILNRVLQPTGAGTVENRIGSYFLNSFSAVVKTQQITLINGDGSYIGDDFQLDGQSAPRGYIDSALATVTVSVVGAETAFTVANWGTHEPSVTFRNGHIYRVELQCKTSASASGDNTIATMLRKGSATTSGLLLWRWDWECNNLFASAAKLGVGYIRNASGADITTKLSLSAIRSGGANTVTVGGDGTMPMTLTVQDLGLSANSQLVRLSNGIV